MFTWPFGVTVRNLLKWNLVFIKMLKRTFPYHFCEYFFSVYFNVMHPQFNAVHYSATTSPMTSIAIQVNSLQKSKEEFEKIGLYEKYF